MNTSAFFYSPVFCSLACHAGVDWLTLWSLQQHPLKLAAPSRRCTGRGSSGGCQCTRHAAARSISGASNPCTSGPACGRPHAKQFHSTRAEAVLHPKAFFHENQKTASRRRFLGHGAHWPMAGAALPVTVPAFASPSLDGARSLSFDHTHTNKKNLHWSMQWTTHLSPWPWAA